MIKLKTLLTENNGGGNCYQMAGNFVVDHNSKKYTLVHGMVNGQGELTGLKFGHGWVEDGNVVIDNSNGNNIKMDKDLYYKLGHIKRKDKDSGGTIDATWKQIVSNGAAKNYNNDENEFNKSQSEYISKIISGWKQMNVKSKANHILGMKGEIEKLTKKLNTL